ncbi:hypothetical protein GQ44DRAFT_732802 [Phaeosphaeriaceae sp. PMI808]|nr:hypothetical protein GQ44DRAFT_732802 [Phaeosphaeriaceae sp. PMI808]
MGPLKLVALFLAPTTTVSTFIGFPPSPAAPSITPSQSMPFINIPGLPSAPINTSTVVPDVPITSAISALPITPIVPVRGNETITSEIIIPSVSDNVSTVVVTKTSSITLPTITGNATASRNVSASATSAKSSGVPHNEGGRVEIGVALVLGALVLGFVAA